MTYAIKPNGYVRVLRPNGTQVSQHATLDQAIVAALNQPPNVEYTLNLPDYTVKNTTAAPPPPPNQAPAVTLTSPADGVTLIAPATISIAATATDDRGVQSVEFFVNDVSFNVDISSPYGVIWAGVPVGDYEIKAKALDANGASTTTPVRTVHVRAETPPPPPTGEPALPLLAAYPITGTVPQIALGESYTDPSANNIRITRVSDNNHRQNYSRRQVFNAGGTRRLMYRVNAGTWGLYDKATNAFIRTLNLLAGGDNIEPLWHPTDPKILRYHNGLKWYDHNVETNTSTLLFDFAGKLPWSGATEVWTKGEGRDSADGKRLCLMATHYNNATGQSTMFGVLTFNPMTKEIISTLNMTAYPDHLSTSLSGRWCVISGSTTFAVRADNLSAAAPLVAHLESRVSTKASRQALAEKLDGVVHLFTRGESKLLADMRSKGISSPLLERLVSPKLAAVGVDPMAQLHDRSEHSDLCLGKDGHDYYVACAYSGVDEGWVFAVDMDAGTKFRTTAKVYGAQSSFTSMHISGQSQDRPGFFTASAYNDASNYGNTVPSAVLEPCYRRVTIHELKPNGKAWSVTPIRTTGRDYYDEPQATANQDLTEIVYASRLGPTGLSSAYSVAVPWAAG